MIEAGNDRPTPEVYCGVALVSGAAIASQVCLTRVFAISLWHHFAYLVIGIALLGYGIAGSLLTARGGAVLDRDGSLAEVLSKRGTAAATGTTVALLILATIRTNSLALFEDPSVGVALVLIVMLSAVPFLGAGIVIGTALAAYRGRSGSVYASDLVGAGIGAVASAALLHGLAAPRLLFAAAATTGIASLLFALRANGRRRLLAAAAIFPPALVTLAYGDDDHWVRPAPAKEINTFHFPDIGFGNVEYRAWTPQGRVDVSGPRESLPYLGGDTHYGALVKLRSVTQDGAAPTALYPIPPNVADLGFFPFTSVAAAWVMRGATLHEGPAASDGPAALVIGVGGGADVAMALAFGAGRVTGVEINPAMVDLLTKRYYEYTGRLASRPGVRLVNADGRAYVRSTKDRYAVIQLSGVDTFTALASGAYSLAEAYVYTVEAFEDYLAHLGPDGCLSMSRLILDPPRETLRLAGSAAQAMRNRGDAEPWRRILIVSGEAWATLLACKRPIGAAQVRRVRDWAAQMRFTVRFDPLAPSNDAFGRLLVLDEAARAKLVERYPYRLDPATDEAPFFFDYYRWKNVFSLVGLRKQVPYASKVPIGHGLLLGALLLTTLLASIGILLPLRRLGIPLGRDKKHFLAYFAGLGIAFLFIEASLLQRLTFLLGHPTHGLTVVLGSLLVSSGVGAALSRRMSRRLAWRALPLALTIGSLAVAWGSYRLLPSLIGLTFLERLGVALALIVPLGVLMGMPFPVGLERLRRSSPELIPWAFGVNAFFTVIASSLAPILAMQVGFSALLAIAAGAYAVAFATVRRAAGTA